MNKLELKESQWILSDSSQGAPLQHHPLLPACRFITEVIWFTHRCTDEGQMRRELGLQRERETVRSRRSVVRELNLGCDLPEMSAQIQHIVLRLYVMIWRLIHVISPILWRVCACSEASRCKRCSWRMTLHSFPHEWRHQHGGQWTHLSPRLLALWSYKKTLARHLPVYCKL